VERLYVSRKNCANCGILLDPEHKHECFEPFCNQCQQNKEIGHLYYVIPLVNELPKSDDILFVFYDFETTQDTKFSDSATEHIPNVVCNQQYCLHCEMQPDVSVDCKRCGKRRHSFYDDSVGDFLSSFCAPQKWCEKVIAIAHNAKGFDEQFILNRAIFLKWQPKLILNGKKNYLYAVSASDFYRFCFVSTYATV